MKAGSIIRTTSTGYQDAGPGSEVKVGASFPMPAGQSVDELLLDTKMIYTATGERVILSLPLAADRDATPIAGILPP